MAEVVVRVVVVVTVLVAVVLVVMVEEVVVEVVVVAVQVWCGARLRRRPGWARGGTRPSSSMRASSGAGVWAVDPPAPWQEERQAPWQARQWQALPRETSLRAPCWRGRETNSHRQRNGPPNQWPADRLQSLFYRTAANPKLASVNSRAHESRHG